MPIFVAMKQLMLILLFILSNLFGVGVGRTDYEQLPDSNGAIYETPQERHNDRFDTKNACITSPRSTSFSGEEESTVPLMRRTNTGRQTHESSKTPSRILKSGKIVDNNTALSFQVSLIQFASGPRATNRYIYLIRHLII